MLGPTLSVHVVALVPFPAQFVTLLFPVLVPFGTVALPWISTLFPYTTLFRSLKLTPVVPVKPVPVSVTLVPVGPLAGGNNTILNTTHTQTLFALVSVPAAFVTVIFPVVAPVVTVALIFVSEFTVNVVAAVPLKLTPVAPVNPVPVSVTLVATGPLAGRPEEHTPELQSQTHLVFLPVP